MTDDISEKPLYADKDVTPRDLLQFARQILISISIIFIISWFADLFIPSRGIFDCCKTILPSIATLVIGYYFGKNN